jgi:hypothetical protein
MVIPESMAPESQADLLANGTAINAGLNIRTTTVPAKQMTYTAYQGADGIINVWGITVS